MSSVIKVNTIQDSGGNAILSSDGSGNVTQTRTGITMVDNWRLTTDVTANETPLGSTTSLERVDDATFSKIGTGMTESSGVFTFPQTGLYKIESYLGATPNSDTIAMQIQVSSNSGSSYDSVALHYVGSAGGAIRGGSTRSCLVNVTNATNFRIKFDLTSIGAGSTVHGDTDQNETNFMFIRLGDSQ